MRLLLYTKSSPFVLAYKKTSLIAKETNITKKKGFPIPGHGTILGQGLPQPDLGLKTGLSEGHSFFVVKSERLGLPNFDNIPHS